VTPEESCTSASAARIFGTSATERASPLRAPLAFALSSAAGWLHAAWRGQVPPPRAAQPREALIRPSAQPSEAGQGGCHHWIFGRSLGAPRTSSDRCSMRSAHTAAFPIASACARSSRATLLGRRLHAKQEHRRPAQELRIELHADCLYRAAITACAENP
jgi:hypothetical protein